MVGDTVENKYLPVYRIVEGFILEVNGKEVSKFSFPLVDPDLGY